MRGLGYVWWDGLYLWAEETAAESCTMMIKWYWLECTPNGTG